jgi:uncharacterized RDD family membrane protein YckC
MDDLTAGIFIFVIVILIIILLFWIYLDYSQNASIKAELRKRALEENVIKAIPKHDYNSPISRNSGIAKISNNPQSSVSSTGQLGTEKDVILHRVLAVIIDYIVLGFLSLFLSATILASIVPEWATNPIMAPAAGLIAIIMTLFLVIILWIPYAIILETWRGQTIGKMILGIVVVKENGEPCTFVAALLRNVLRIIDVLPQFYAIGFIAMALTEKRQRIGDRLANTIVVRIKR